MRWLSVLALAVTWAPTDAQTFTTIKSFGIFTNIGGFRPLSALVLGADGSLYGTTSLGEALVAGTVFRLQPDGSGFRVLKRFTNSLEGANPSSGVTLSGSVLYGTTLNGGKFGFGTVFKINADGTGYAVLRNFSGSPDGAYSHGGLTISGSTIYGTTSQGGDVDKGTIFRLNTDGSGYAVLKSFDGNDGESPSAGVTLSGSVLFGTASSGGLARFGTVFRMNADGTGFTVLKSFDEGFGPKGALTLSHRTLYGTTSDGGTLANGTVFKLNLDGTGYTVLKTFSGGDGMYPNSGLTSSGSELYGTTSSGGSSGKGTVFEVNTNGTGYTVLKSFTYEDGESPAAGLTVSGIMLYGTTAWGGSSEYGTVFKIEKDGARYTVLKSFVPSDGVAPVAALTMNGGQIYGTTSYGGNSDRGTAFKLNIDGSGYALLREFLGASDGAYPEAGLALFGGVLYGTTYLGGDSGSSTGGGTLFRVNTNGAGYGALKNLTNAADGALPQGDLTSSGSVLYGTTSSGGDLNDGTVFRVNTDGTDYTVLKSFADSPDGATPLPGLTLLGSVLYGTTSAGGSSGHGTVFRLNADGTGYSILKHFTDAPDGAYPVAGLTLAGGVLYGTTRIGGGQHYGTVFKIRTDGTSYEVLKELNGSDGAYPFAGVIPSGKVLYGATRSGGSHDFGTIFKLNTDGTGYVVLKNFINSDDGAFPEGGLTMSGGALYGTTSQGGYSGYGTVFKLDLSPLLRIQTIANAVLLSWPDPSFALQSSPLATGVYTNIAGATSPYTNTVIGSQLFFRLIGN